MKPISKERAQEIVDELNGTCKSIAECLEDGEDDSDPVLTAKIDDQIFCCSRCDWWCEQGEAHEGSDGDVCDDCEEE